MKLIATGSKRSSFNVLHSTHNAQAAMMTLRPGQSTSDKPENEHPRCEQWLFVLKGSGRATVGRRSVQLRPNSLLLIEKSEAHRITNTGRKLLVTLNLYAPPAYRSSGDVKMLARVPTLMSAIRMK
jgi:mannose-6-phosphate isomerase-like protein (cupin superfamily)